MKFIILGLLFVGSLPVLGRTSPARCQTESNDTCSIEVTAGRVSLGKGESLEDHDRSVQDLLDKQILAHGRGGTDEFFQFQSQCDTIQAALIEYFVNKLFFYG